MTCLQCSSEAEPGKRFCETHKGKPKPKKRISFHSDKRKKQQVEYRKIVKGMMEESNRCELNIEGVCVTVASGLHHVQRRGKNLLNKGLLMRSCNPCNSWIEQYPKEAKEKGFLISKFKP